MNKLATILFLIFAYNYSIGQDELKDFEIGYEHYLNGEFDSAIKYFDKSINKHPDHGDSYFFKALVLARTGDFETALPLFNRAIEINPNDGAYYGDRGIVFAYTGQKTKALQDFKFAAKYDSLNPARHFNLAAYYLNEGEIENAKTHLTNCLNVNPNHLNARFKRAICSTILDQRNEAINDYTYVIENFEDQSTVLNPLDFQEILGIAYHMRGGIYGEDKQYEHAVSDLKKSVEYKKDNPEIFNSLGYYQIFIGDLDNSFKNLNKSIQMDPNVNNYNSRAFAYYKLGKLDLAEKDALKAIELENEHPESYYNLALIYKETGDLDLSCENRTKALNLGLSKSKDIIIEDCK